MSKTLQLQVDIVEKLKKFEEIVLLVEELTSLCSSLVITRRN